MADALSICNLNQWNRHESSHQVKYHSCDRTIIEDKHAIAAVHRFIISKPLSLEKSFKLSHVA